MVFCKDSLNYYRDLTLFLDEAHRVLNDNGVCVITEMVGKYYNYPLIRVIRAFIRQFLSKLRGRLEWEDTEYKTWMKKEVLSAANASHLNIEEVRYIPSEKRFYLAMRK
jgi:ubiquinone/menaquinone biosynthesis C-methylase UbiE